MISQNDRAGRTTTFEYDELNRQVKTNLPDGTSTRAIYSAGGRVAVTVDAKGNRTDYTYDTAGRRTATTLPAVQNGISGPPVRPQTSTVLNSLGAPTAVFDRTDGKRRTSTIRQGVLFEPPSPMALSFNSNLTCSVVVQASPTKKERQQPSPMTDWTA